MAWLDVVERARALGSRTLPDGTELTGRVPHVGRDAWLHLLFRPLRASEIGDLETALGRELPEEFRGFLAQHNGLSVFSDSLSIDGLRTNYARAGDAIWQPYSLLTPNREERPTDAPGSVVFIGAYSWDGSRLYIDDANGGRVFRCRRDSVAPLNAWATVCEMLEAEIERLSHLFGSDGRPLDRDLPTVPDTGLPH